MDHRLDDDAELAAVLVREAGRLAHGMRNGVTARHKTSAGDLVTAADQAAEAHIAGRLADERPGDGLLGEEGTSGEGTTGRTWVIDPVDGTYNFVHGLTWWCSALALRDGDGVLLGAVHHPHDDQLWLGGRELPTTRNGTPVHPIADRPLADCSVTTYLNPRDFAVPDIVEPFSAMTAPATALRIAGSGSMDMAAVADGRIDLWCQHTVPPWDLLPGHGLVDGAGGTVAQVTVRGVTWALAGPPTAVGEAADLLASARTTPRHRPGRDHHLPST